MSINISSNLYASYANQSLRTHYDRLQTSVRRLSTGVKVNSSADSPTGKAMRERLRAEVSSLQAGISNAEHAVSTVQTADAAIGEINSNLNRMKELAEQAATGTYTDTQRVIINSEFQTIASEIDRIANDTEFFGTNLLDSSVTSNVPGAWMIGSMDFHNFEIDVPQGHYTNDNKLKVHIGSGNNASEDYYNIQLSDMTMDGIFKDSIDVSNPDADSSAEVVSIGTQGDAMRALEQIDAAINKTTYGSAALGAAQNRLDASIDHMISRTEAIQGAESKISDIDVAEEMSKFTKNQIMTQAATSIVAQANALPEMALKLLA